ncbi:MAG: TldD/PmbA family protein [candidate division Zixibacteria bacterium]|nr:TldD/PmbA family protein [candidate division Zixibacteria bacterium]
MIDRLKDAAEFLRSKGVTYGDVRYVHTTREAIQLTNDTVDTLTNDVDQGFGIRVLMDGAWGFASSAVCTAGEMRKVANRAIQIAKASALTKREDVILAEQEPVKGTFETPFDTDPFRVSLSKKVKVLAKVNSILKKNPKVRVAESTMDFIRTRKIFVSTDGAEIDQTITESGAGYTCTAVGDGEVQRRSYPNSHRGDWGTAGYEFIERMDLVGHAERVREEAIELLTAPPCPSGERTIIINGSQMALQVHESCGHPVELDRVLGTEISLAGGSFLTLDKMGGFRYGAPIVTIVGDATVHGGLGSFGFDDEGVPAQRFDIVRDGIFVGYLTSRETAPRVNQRSNGTMRADGWNRVPLIRMTNINLEPGDAELDALMADSDGALFLDTNKSWSIDDQRLNFQFGLEAAWEIKGGKKGQIYKNPLYTGITPQFWNSCDAICNRNHWHIWGVPNCGKGEPMQTSRVAHGAAPARFHNVTVGVSQ